MSSVFSFLIVYICLPNLNIIKIQHAFPVVYCQPALKN